MSSNNYCNDNVALVVYYKHCIVSSAVFVVVQYIFTKFKKSIKLTKNATSFGKINYTYRQ